MKIARCEADLFFHSLQQMDLHPRLGNFFEGFVVEEVIRGSEATTAHNTRYSHFRTRAGGEIDLIAEGSFGLLPIEVKYQSQTSPKSLTSMTNFLDLHNLPCGIVLNNAEKPAMITDRIIEVPVGCH
jgi:predicted AAA+ superfamily ATPase